MRAAFIIVGVQRGACVCIRMLFLRAACVRTISRKKRALIVDRIGLLLRATLVESWTMVVLVSENSFVRRGQVRAEHHILDSCRVRQGLLLTLFDR